MEQSGPARAIVVASGGLDSTVLAYQLRADGFGLHLLSFDYGQRHRKELQFAKRIADRLDAPWTKVDLAAGGISALLGKSALTDEQTAVPDGHYAWENMRITVVPNRNAIMLTMAYALAMSEGASVVATAVHAGDHAIYPDCRSSFIKAFEAMERLACEGLGEAELRTPFLGMTKSEIVATGARLGVPFDDTWSCYKGADIHCGACGTCFERREAFQQAGVPDPTEYASFPMFAAPA